MDQFREIPTLYSGGKHFAHITKHDNSFLLAIFDTHGAGAADPIDLLANQSATWSKLWDPPEATDVNDVVTVNLNVFRDLAC